MIAFDPIKIFNVRLAQSHGLRKFSLQRKEAGTNQASDGIKASFCAKSTMHHCAWHKKTFISWAIEVFPLPLPRPGGLAWVDCSTGVHE
jgi:hypothetical protein